MMKRPTCFFKRLLSFCEPQIQDAFAEATVSPPEAAPPADVDAVADTSAADVLEFTAAQAVEIIDMAAQGFAQRLDLPWNHFDELLGSFKRKAASASPDIARFSKRDVEILLAQTAKECADSWKSSQHAPGD